MGRWIPENVNYLKSVVLILESRIEKNEFKNDCKLKKKWNVVLILNDWILRHLSVSLIISDVL